VVRVIFKIQLEEKIMAAKKIKKQVKKNVKPSAKAIKGGKNVSLRNVSVFEKG